MIPNNINKNLNKKGDENGQLKPINGKSYSAMSKPLGQIDSNVNNVNVMYCEESEIMRPYRGGTGQENMKNIYSQ